MELTLFHKLLTMLGLISFGIIVILQYEQKVSERAFYITSMAGILSWATQMYLFTLITLTPVNNLQLLTITSFAFFSFIVVVLLSYFNHISREQTELLIFYGLPTYPLVLVSFLPQGIHTLLALF